MRRRLWETATSYSVVDYRSAGVDPLRPRSQDFFFLEVNTRLQVEHGVPRPTGIDIVGGRCDWDRRFGRTNGRSIEARIYARTPRVSSVHGLLTRSDFDGIRCDTWVAMGPR